MEHIGNGVRLPSNNDCMFQQNNSENPQPHALMALNYHPTTEKVAEMGYSIIRNMGARLTLLHVLSEPSWYSSAEYSPIMGFTGYADMRTWAQENNEQIVSESERFLNQIKDCLNDPAIRIMVREGNFADTILKVAKEKNASLIIIGSHHPQGLELLSQGNVTEQILLLTEVPVIVIPTMSP